MRDFLNAGRHDGRGAVAVVARSVVEMDHELR